MRRFATPLPELQITFFNRLQELREKLLLDALLSTVSEADVTKIDKDLELRNAAGRRVRVEFASDPDICVREELPSAK